MIMVWAGTEFGTRKHQFTSEELEHVLLHLSTALHRTHLMTDSGSGDVPHRTYLSQRLQLLQLFVVVVRILSIIFQDELEEKKQGKQADNLYISGFNLIRKREVFSFHLSCSFKPIGQVPSCFTSGQEVNNSAALFVSAHNKIMDAGRPQRRTMTQQHDKQALFPLFLGKQPKLQLI